MLLVYDSLRSARILLAERYIRDLSKYGKDHSSAKIHTNVAACECVVYMSNRQTAASAGFSFVSARHQYCNAFIIYVFRSPHRTHTHNNIHIHTRRPATRFCMRTHASNIIPFSTKGAYNFPSMLQISDTLLISYIAIYVGTYCTLCIILVSVLKTPFDA